MAAWKKWEGIDVEAIIAKVRAEESKLPTEDREQLEVGITKLREDLRKGNRRAVALNMFFGVLRAAISVVSRLTLGVPITIPSLTEDSRETDCNGLQEHAQPIVSPDKKAKSASNSASVQNGEPAISNGTTFEVLRRRNSQASSTAGLLAGQEPTFVGVVMNRKGTLKVVNAD
jgi:hypothetical protein